LNMKKLTPQLLLPTIVLLTGLNVSAQTTEQNINVIIRPSQTVEERVANDMREKDLRKAAEEKRAAEESARIAETGPKALLRKARTVYICSDTSFFDDIQLQNALRKRDEFENWQMAIIDGGNSYNVADIVVRIDSPLFTYEFTYQITSRNNNIVLATGKVVAFDGNAAAPQLAARIIEEIKIARGEAKPKK
jgi:hypothetical protein